MTPAHIILARLLARQAVLRHLQQQTTAPRGMQPERSNRRWAVLLDLDVDCPSVKINRAACVVGENNGHSVRAADVPPHLNPLQIF